MKIKHFQFQILIVSLLVLAGCANYKQNIMFKTGEPNTYAIKSAIDQADKNYIIKKNDILDIKVYTNNGERLIDPNMEFEVGGNNNIQSMQQQATRPQYLVQKDGNVRLPMVGLLKLEGYTLNQSDSLLQIAYSKFYTDAFVYSSYSNKRMFVLGAIGGGGSGGGSGGRVVPLDNEDMNLIEVLALVGGVTRESIVQNIRLIRGDLKNPYVEVINLSTIEGMKKATLKMEPNDIIYIEPQRRPFLEAFRDYSPIAGFFTGLGSLGLTTIILIRTLNRPN